MEFLIIFAAEMVVVAQLVRASDCDSEGRGFEPHHPPLSNPESSFRICFYRIGYANQILFLTA